MKHHLSILFILIFWSLNGQNVSINNTGSAPDASAILDVQSQTKGFLLPRMTALERTSIQFPQTGLLVYDLDLQSLFYWDGGYWIEFSGSRNGFRDKDLDTRVEVEENLDEDIIRLYAKGNENLKIEPDSVHLSIAETSRLKVSGDKFELFDPSRNTVIGKDSKPGNSGFDNTILGYKAGENMNDGQRNTLIGTMAGDAMALFGPDDNTFIGYNAGTNLELNSDRNIGIGSNSGLFGSGTDNIAIGTGTGNFTSGTSRENIFIGKDAGTSSEFGVHQHNIAIGINAGQGIDGDNNIFIGENAGTNTLGCDNCIMIGKNAGGTIPWNNVLHIDNETTYFPLIYGDFSSDHLSFNGKVGVNLTSFAPDCDLHLKHESSASIAGFKIENEGSNENYWRLYTTNSTGSLRFYSKEGEGNSCGNNSGADDYVAWISGCSGAWNSTSDRRKKKNLNRISNILPTIMQMKVYDYNFISEDDSTKKHIGLIAQDVEPYFPQLVNYDDELDLYTMNYSGIAPIAIQGIQELKVENEALKNQLDRMEKLIESLSREVKDLKKETFENK